MLFRFWSYKRWVFLDPGEARHDAAEAVVRTTV
jgi:hypothetical protein